MRSRIGLTVVALVAAMSPAVSAPVSASLAGCAVASLPEAAKRLVHSEAEVVATSVVGGFRSALVLAPIIHPGVRYRLIQAGAAWCHAQSGFNEAWRLSGRSRRALDQARAYAQLAPAPWFDGVTVTSAKEIKPGTIALETHAVTNGITAEWTVAVDRGGVRRADWRATGIGVRPFEPSWEGLTALPGASRSFVRNGSGLLAESDPLLRTSGPPPIETVMAEAVAADGFRMSISHGGSGFAVALNEDTGVAPVDTVRTFRRLLKDNYDEFLSWGLHGGWIPADRGVVYVDDALSVFCIACVFVARDFNIHMSSQTVTLLAALGYTYPDAERALSTVIGHEMFHNFQHAYYQPGAGRSMSGAYVEGLARFQETLHDYSHVSHQPGSLVYANDINGCNGYLGGSQLSSGATGPVNGRLYNACYFWLAFYAHHGLDGFVSLVESSADHAPRASWDEFENMIEDASGVTVSEEIAAFAATAVTRHGYSWAAADGTLPEHDWVRHLEVFSPAVLPGGSETSPVNLSAGGMLMVEVTGAGRIDLDGAADLYVVRYAAPGTETTPVTDGTLVAAPVAGERVWLLAVNPSAGTREVSLGYPAP